MTFNEQLTITLIDKLAIGMVVLLAGFWLNRALKDLKESRLSGENSRFHKIEQP